MATETTLTPLGIALFAAVFIVGVVLVIVGVRRTGWPRPVLITIGVLMALVPILVYVDVAFARWEYTVR